MAKGKVIFLHPDLGLGGAERLVVDAALSLKKQGFDVSFVTSHHDKNHCFQDTKDGTLPVTVIGDFLPRHIFGKFYALCAYIRMLLCSLYIIMYEKPDLVFCDLVSACIPVLQFKVPKVIFYCHFPDQLLSKKGSCLKAFYRLPLNWLEEKTTGRADKILVNSYFTKSVFKKTFTSLTVEPDILYPSINVKPFDEIPQSYDLFTDFIKEYDFPEKSIVLLSINRYEKKKSVELSLKSLSKLKEILNSVEWSLIRLIIAGGHDNRVQENVEYFAELKKMTEELGLNDKVVLLKSPSDDEKIKLLKNCHCLIYTPSNEHFGIVPLEAMYCSKPVVAVNSGGPTETIVNGETGFLCEPNEKDFSKALAALIQDKKLRETMGTKGQKRFISLFSFTAFTDNISNIVTELIK